MTDNPFKHKDSHIVWGLPRLLAIIDRVGPIRADSESAAARGALRELQCASKLGRSIDRREERMRKIIGAGIQMGYLRYNRKSGLDWTEAGEAALSRWRESGPRQRVGSNERRVHGMRPLPTGN